MYSLLLSLSLIGSRRGPCGLYAFCSIRSKSIAPLRAKMARSALGDSMYMPSPGLSLHFYHICEPRVVSANKSQIKLPQSYQSSRNASNASSSSNNFAKSIGPGRYAPSDRPPVSRSNGRPGHARSKSQAPRPRTAHGRYEEEEQEPPAGGNGTTDISQLSRSLPPQAHPMPRKVWVQPPIQAHSFSTGFRESSLDVMFRKLKISEQVNNGVQVISRPSSRLSLKEPTTSEMTNITLRRSDKSNLKAKVAPPGVTSLEA